MVDRSSPKARGKRPFSRHPLFPAIVALWSAALFALGSLAIRPALAEALAAAGAGGMIGLFAAMRFARSRSETNGAVAGADGSVGKEETSDPLWTELKSHRRALAAGRNGPEPGAEARPPAPAREPRILDLASTDFAGLEVEPAPVVVDEGAGGRAPRAAAEEASAGIPAPDRAEPRSDNTCAAERIAGADLDDLSPVELLARLSLSLQRRSRAAKAQIDLPLPAEPMSEKSDDVLAEGYDALRKLGRTAAAGPTDSDRELPVVFPGRTARSLPPAPPAMAGPDDAEETEKALRSALAALQRMSGSA